MLCNYSVIMLTLRLEYLFHFSYYLNGEQERESGWGGV